MGLPGAHGSDLAHLAEYLLRNGPRKHQSTSRRVRAILNGVTIVDTTSAQHVWEHDFYPQYYVPIKDLRNCQWSRYKSVPVNSSPWEKVKASLLKVTVSGQGAKSDVETTRVLLFSSDDEQDQSLSEFPLDGFVRLEFGSIDHWLEEDVPIYVHPKDPYKRVDLLPSTRSVEVRVKDKTVAKSPSSVHLLETGLPTRFYLPLASVDQSVLRGSDTITKCPYKGDAEYYDLVVDGETMHDLAWYYRHPTLECAGISGLVCFYNEKVDIVLDGQLLERPKTFFS